MAEHIFPKVSDIIKDVNLIRHMDAAWQMMLNNTSANGRYEYGFYIYYNDLSGTYYIGNVEKGLPVIGCEDTSASVALGRSINNLECCAFFHCHTTLHFCSSFNRRYTGPSSTDKDFAKRKKLPGILYDYAKSYIRGGHAVQDHYKIYTFGPKRREKTYY